jgi:hypothetical protein
MRPSTANQDLSGPGSVPAFGDAAVSGYRDGFARVFGGTLGQIFLRARRPGSTNAGRNIGEEN